MFNVSKSVCYYSEISLQFLLNVQTKLTFSFGEPLCGGCKVGLFFQRGWIGQCLFAMKSSSTTTVGGGGGGGYLFLAIGKDFFNAWAEVQPRECMAKRKISFEIRNNLYSMYWI